MTEITAPRFGEHREPTRTSINVPDISTRKGYSELERLIALRSETGMGKKMATSVDLKRSNSLQVANI